MNARGLHDLERIGRHMKEAGDKGFNREVYRALNSTVKPLAAEVTRHLREYLPDNYADEIVPLFKVAARRRGGSRSPGLALVGSSKSPRGRKKQVHVAALERGVLRKPLFGDKGFWFSQKVKRGFYSEPLEDNADKVRRELVGALGRLGRRITS